MRREPEIAFGSPDEISAKWVAVGSAVLFLALWFGMWNSSRVALRVGPAVRLGALALTAAGMMLNALWWSRRDDFRWWRSFAVCAVLAIPVYLAAAIAAGIGMMALDMAGMSWVGTLLGHAVPFKFGSRDPIPLDPGPFVLGMVLAGPLTAALLVPCAARAGSGRGRSRAPWAPAVTAAATAGSVLTYALWLVLLVRST